jgi:beta-glucosidase
MYSDRITRLLAGMTPAEKLGQLQIVFRPRAEDAAELVREGVGAVFWPRSAAATNAVQRVAVEQTRLGIPLLVGLDVIHGQRTIAPVPLAQAASFDPSMVERLARLAAAEARSGGANWTFSPMLDVTRDPRWGRAVEGFGEDVHVTAELGRAMVRGYQGESLAASDAIAATAKHYVAYGQPEGGRDYDGADVSEHRLRNVHLEPFRAAVEAGAASVMASFNTVAGRPMHANRRLLTGVLKEEWGFDGVVVGDADGVRNLISHGVAAELGDAVRLAYAAGLDIEMGGTPADVDPAELAPSRLDPARVDDAVTRVLALKEALGLFDDPYVPEGDERTEPTVEARRMVREAAARSCVLLKNDGTLPLREPRRVLLTGPYAESTDHLGAWTQSFAAPARSIADELRERRPGADVRVVPGVGFLEDDDSGIAAALAAARDVDLVLVLVGEPSSLSGEAASRSDLRLPGRQADLIRAVAATGTPFAVVLENGRPLVVADWIDRAPSVLEAWHGGTEASAAIVDVLLGDADPSGRLPMSFPRSVGQVPVYYAHERTGRPATTGGTLTESAVDVGLHGPDNVHEKYTSKYLDLELGPQFAFGHGSGYASFTHGLPRLNRDEITLGDLDLDLHRGRGVTVEFDVTNTSDRSGDEVILVFVEDVVASVAPPVRRLVAFERRTLDAGETATFSFDLGERDLGFWATDAADARFVVEPGLFRLHVGPRSTAPRRSSCASAIGRQRTPPAKETHDDGHDTGDGDERLVDQAAPGLPRAARRASRAPARRAGAQLVLILGAIHRRFVRARAPDERQHRPGAGELGAPRTAGGEVRPLARRCDARGGAREQTQARPALVRRVQERRVDLRPELGPRRRRSVPACGGRRASTDGVHLSGGDGEAGALGLQSGTPGCRRRRVRDPHAAPGGRGRRRHRGDGPGRERIRPALRQPRPRSARRAGLERRRARGAARPSRLGRLLRRARPVA